VSREIDEQVQHDHLVELLYREYYDYPNKVHPHLLTFSNHPCKTEAVQSEEGKELFPDLVVYQPRIDRLVLVVEVETESTVTPEEADEWRDFSRLGAEFHLYVPHGLGGVADVLCREFDVTEIIEYRKETNRYVIERYR